MLHVTNDESIVRTYHGEVSHGYFEVKNLLSGRYVIIDAFDGYVFAISDSPIVSVYPEGHVESVEALLKPGASLSGSFVDAESGQPISGVSVNAASEVKDTVDPESSFAHPTETNTKEEFHLTVPNDADTYFGLTIIALHPQYQTQHWQWEMSPDKKVYDLDVLSLKPFLSLQGKVTASNSGYTVDRLKMHLKMHNKPADFFRAGAQPENTVQTDADGNFLFSGLHPIEYSLTNSQNNVIIAFVESVNPESEKPLKIRLPKVKTLHGKVIDAKQNLIPDANLYAARQSENRYGHRALSNDPNRCKRYFSNEDIRNRVTSSIP